MRIRHDKLFACLTFVFVFCLSAYSYFFVFCLFTFVNVLFVSLLFVCVGFFYKDFVSLFVIL